MLVSLVLIIGLSACVPPQSSAPKSDVITILHTNDEHGWILPAERNKTTLASGAAELMGVWQKNEGYPNASTIALSSGDMWTGPAISTWFMGEPTAEVMNAMGYRAAAVGNHDFDFGRDVLKQHRAASKFPFLAANVTIKDG